MFDFKISQTSGRSRSGLIKTSRGNIETPIFMPVGTLGTVKSLTPEDLSACGAQIILGNTYHLYLRPGCEVIDRFEGLHNFMHWDKPILSDSGGFQVFSLAKLSKITEQGYSFQSHLDGSSHLLTPERSIEVQLCLNSDIIMCLDQCLPYPATDAQTHEAMLLTTRWAERCKHVWEAQAGPQNALFGIVQGGMNKPMRQQSAQAIADIGFNGYAIGGLSVGEPKDLMWEMADHTLPYLPDDKPKYIMGVGKPEDLVELVGMGADMFDCVMPTRNARNGQLFTRHGTINIANARHTQDVDPVDTDCGCYTCTHYSRAYLRHLYISKELLAYRLNTIHNISFYLDLVRSMRAAIHENRFAQFKKDFYNTYMNNEG